MTVTGTHSPTPRKNGGGGEGAKRSRPARIHKTNQPNQFLTNMAAAFRFRRLTSKDFLLSLRRQILVAASGLVTPSD